MTHQTPPITLIARWEVLERVMFPYTANILRQAKFIYLDGTPKDDVPETSLIMLHNELDCKCCSWLPYTITFRDRAMEKAAIHTLPYRHQPMSIRSERNCATG